MTSLDLDATLPQGFAALTPFARNWGSLTTQDARYLMRQALPYAELLAFYNAVVPLLPAIFDHLDGFAFGSELPPEEALLYRIVLGLSEVAQAVEVYGQPRVPLAFKDHSVPIGTAN